MYEYVFIRTGIENAGIVRIRWCACFDPHFSRLHTSIRPDVQYSYRTYLFIGYFFFCNTELECCFRSNKLQYSIPCCRNNYMDTCYIHHNFQGYQRAFFFFQL